jgi:hypothetical protein
MKGDGIKPRGAKPGMRVGQASKEDPGRFPGKADPMCDVVVWVGPARRKRYTVARSKLAQTMARHAGNHLKAKAYDAMSGDLVGESFTGSAGFNKPRRWASYP